MLAQYNVMATNVTTCTEKDYISSASNKLKSCRKNYLNYLSLLKENVKVKLQSI